MTQVADAAARAADDPLGLRAYPPRRWHLAGLAVLLAAVYLFGVSGKWWPLPDSALYLSLGRSLADGEGYRVVGDPPGKTSTIVAPGLPLLLAGVRAGGDKGYFTANLLMALCGLGTVLLAYLTVARMADRRLAMAVAMCSGMSYNLFETSRHIISDVPFSLLFWAAMYCALRYLTGRWVWLAAMAILELAALTVRAPGLVILAPMGVGLLLTRAQTATTGLATPPRKKPLIAGAVALGIIVALAALLLLTIGPEQYHLRSQLRRLSAGQEGLAESVGRGVLALPASLAELLTSQSGLWWLSLPIAALTIVGCCRLWRRGDRLVPMLVVVPPLLLAVAGEPLPRYLLPLLPLLVYTAMLGLFVLVQYLTPAQPLAADGQTPPPLPRGVRRASPKSLLIAATILGTILVGLNVPRLMRDAFYYGYYSHTDRYYDKVRDGKFRELMATAELLRDKLPSAGGTAAVTGGPRRMLEYLMDRPMLRLPEGRATTRHALLVARTLRRTPAATLAVVEVDKAQPEFLKELARQTDRAGWKNLRPEGRDYYVYIRTVTAKPTSDPTSDAREDAPADQPDADE